jgi:hypothetical protein
MEKRKWVYVSECSNVETTEDTDNNNLLSKIKYIVKVCCHLILTFAFSCFLIKLSQGSQE